MTVQTLDPPQRAGISRPDPRIHLLRIAGLSKHFGEVYALRDFHLEVQGGEFISLLGPSGCGKTTALNCLAGLLDADGGQIEVDGQSIMGTPPERRHFGMVFQNYALFPHLTVGRNIAFGLEMTRMPAVEIQERVTRVLRLVQLAQHATKYPAQLSGGQQQRVAIARAIVTEPRLMLMDEPLSNLDAKLRLEMRSEIRRLHQELGLTTIYVTHDQEEALSLSDRIVLMRGGLIQQVGTPRDVYEQPNSIYSASFLGYRNVLPVQVIAVTGQEVRIRTERGIELVGSAHGPLTPQMRAIAAIRPEDIMLLGSDSDEGHGVSGIIETVEFLGRESELSVQNELGARLIVRTTALWQRDMPVQLQLPAQRLLIFPEEVE